MVPTSTLLPFIAASLVLLLVPGPAVLYILARSSAQGTRAGLVAVLGVHSASVIHVLAAVVGLSAVITASATAFTTVKLIGGVYVISLGVRTLLSARREATDTADTPPPRTGPRPARRLFVESVIVNLLNPKVALFFMAFLPQFVDPVRGPVWVQTLALGLLYVAIGTTTDGAYAVVGGSVGRWAIRRAGGRAACTARTIEGGVLIGLGVVALAIPHRRT